MKSTGIKDKNGKMIHVGDRIRRKNSCHYWSGAIKPNNGHQYKIVTLKHGALNIRYPVNNWEIVEEG